MSMGKTFVRFRIISYPVSYPNPTYQLTVTSNPPGLPISGGGQFCKQQVAQVSVPSTIVDTGNGTRYVFTGWSGDYTGTSPTGQVTMRGSKSIVANFKEQYLLTVTSPYGTPSGSGWYDDDTTAHASLDKTIVDIATGVRAKFTGWTGDAKGESIPNALQMTGPKTVTAQWKNQYYVSVSSQIGQVNGSGWYDEGSQITISVNSPVPAGYGSQYNFDKWIGATQLQASSAQITVDRPLTLQATWKLDQTQLYETVALGVAGIIVVAIATAWLILKRRRPPAASADSKTQTS